MSQQDDKSFFDRLGEILNAPLPGTQTPDTPAPAAQPEASGGVEDPSLLERIKEILNTPLPGSVDARRSPTEEVRQDPPRAGPAQGDSAATPAQAQPHLDTDTVAARAQRGERTPELDEDDLDEHWWKQDWAAFRDHQANERLGLEQKQRGDLAKFTSYQDQEKRRFEAHQQQELNAFHQQQQWRLNAWKQAAAASPGSRPPPPPWGMPAPPGMMPPGGPPPWMRPLGPRRRR